MIHFGDQSADIYIIQPVNEKEEEFLEKEIELIKSMTDKEFCLVAVPVEDWNKDLSPWEAAPVFGTEGFGSGAGEFLKKIEDEIIALNPNKRFIIAGYSLAGLFGLWASCNTDNLAGVMAASPSAWFPGFKEYIKDYKPKADTIYLSLGDKEAKTKNPVMKTVDTSLLNIYETIEAYGIITTFEWNVGNHFKDVDLRCAKGIAWVLNNI